MSAPALALVALAGLGLAAFVMDVAGRAGKAGVPAARALEAAMRTTPGRVAVLAAWLWIGVHFLAR